jgi:hypothetical protein
MMGRREEGMPPKKTMNADGQPRNDHKLGGPEHGPHCIGYEPDDASLDDASLARARVKKRKSKKEVKKDKKGTEGKTKRKKRKRKR